uniref:Uncharacterized protein n=1 Tax=Arundo donax TaxID=35708 RepID=A0A0A9A858_ARUDO
MCIYGCRDQDILLHYQKRYLQQTNSGIDIF